MMLRIAFGILLTNGFATAISIVNLSSPDTTWTLSSNTSLNISVPGTVPSQAHLDLFAAGVIGDPYFGSNTFDQRWVAETTWIYKSAPISLNDSAAVSGVSSTYLVFNGLDTFASVSFCGQLLGTTINQFRQYIFDVSSALRNCTIPSINVKFAPAPRVAAQTAAALNSPVWPNVTGGPSNDFQFQYPYREFIRKEQSDFGWDWGPAFSPAGIWKPAFVVQIGEEKDGVYVTNALVDVYRHGQVNNLPPDQTQPWVVNASINFLGTLPEDVEVDFLISDAANNTFASGLLENVTTTTSSITGSIFLSQEPSLWWPHGLGPQTLYTLILFINAGTRELAVVQRRVGFRTIVLNMEPITSAQLAQGIAPGNNWHFEINGREFYAKGSNFIPPDAFWPRVTPAQMHALFDSVVAGNQNMLRVWASGAYLPDFIYDMADQAGVLLWSEFEFGDAMYPVDDGFLNNIREEAGYNVRRVNHHPSLALWAGGNELEELVLASAQRQDPANADLYRRNYEKLFLETLLPVVYANSRSISYTPTSTGNGYLYLNHSTDTMTERYNNKTNGSLYGDTDYYNYNATLAFNLSSYPVGRFANEFGFHSMPSLQTWRQVLPPDQLFFNSTDILIHNNHYPPGSLSTTNRTNSLRGMGEMTAAVQLYYPLPQSLDPTTNFSAWCLTTQIFQAAFYKSQIAFYRRGSGFPERQLGSLYWQLEDIWQAPTWAGIEYDGRWKVLHHVAADAFQPVIVAPYFNASTGDLQVWVTSDLWNPVNGSVTLAWYDWRGRLWGEPTTAAVSVGPLNTTCVLQRNVNNMSFVLDDAVLVMDVAVVGRRPNSDMTETFTHRNFFHPVPLRDARLVDPGIDVGYDASEDAFSVSCASGVAVWTWLDYPEDVVGYFEENAFLMLPGEVKEVRFTVQTDGTAGRWREGVTVRSLWNNTLA